MLSLPGVQDHVMGDGTTAFSMALARCDIKLIKSFLSSNIPSDIDQHELAKEALYELKSEPTKSRSELMGVLISSLLAFQGSPERSFKLCKE